MTSAPLDVDEPIQLVEPDPRWPELFRGEAERVRAAVGDAALGIEHVGSTSVPLVGKPIVDLLIGVESLEIGRAITPRLVGLGYQDFGDVFIPERLYLRRRGALQFNIAIAKEGGWFFSSQIAVREYLRAHPEAAEAYAAEKRRAYAQGARLFSTYSREKHDFVTALVAEALEWASANHAPG
jgi:GrpB-like predicted nucleotidyltransferase (UPF0157 family)